jgi:CubicO group peptidase (beta-lactamase class C family)
MSLSIKTKFTEIAQKTNFSGVIHIKHEQEKFQKAFNYRDKANKIENNLKTRFAIASGTKGFTSVGIGKLIEKQELSLKTPVREILKEEASFISNHVTISHLLGHTSGIGDYFDEETDLHIEDVSLEIPPQKLISPFDYFPLLKKKEKSFNPGEKFSYCNSGYILLAAIIERISNQPFQQFIQENVFNPAKMTSSGFFRSDSLPENTAIGYLSKTPDRSNLFHLPIIGSGDGGAYTTLSDMVQFWKCLLNNKLLVREITEKLTTQQTVFPKYCLGFWYDDKLNQVTLEGYDAGVSFFSTYSQNLELTILSNTASGAWPLLNEVKTLIKTKK